MVLTETERDIRLKNFRGVMLNHMKLLGNSVNTVIQGEYFNGTTLTEVPDSVCYNNENISTILFTAMIITRAKEIIAHEITLLSTEFPTMTGALDEFLEFFTREFTDLMGPGKVAALLEELCRNAGRPVNVPVDMDIIKKMNLIVRTTVNKVFIFKVYGHIIQHHSDKAFE